MLTPTGPGNSEKAIPFAATLLVLEDNPFVMMVLRLMLEQYSLIEASTAEHALRLFIDHGRKIDLLVADVTLPTSSGIQVALLLRKKTSTLPVILTSGHPVSAWNDRDSADLERLGSNSVAILLEPFQPQELSNAVRVLLAPLTEKTTTACSDSEPPKGRLSVSQSRGTVTVLHGDQHGPNVRHGSIQLIRNRMVDIT
jgi:DNA-binding response OmpR family regulator